MENQGEKWNKGFIKIVVMLMMNKEPVYGNKISNEIFERTNGMWKPSAGSIYPALDKCIEEGLAESYREDGRVMYVITQKGKNFLKEIGERQMTNFSLYKFIGKMWMEVLNPRDQGDFLLRHIQNIVSTIDSLSSDYAKGDGDARRFELLLTNLELELENALEKVREIKSESVVKQGVETKS